MKYMMLVYLDEQAMTEEKRAHCYVESAQLTQELKDRKSTRLNSSHGYISYAVFCLKKKKNICSRSDEPLAPARAPSANDPLFILCRSPTGLARCPPPTISRSSAPLPSTNRTRTRLA